jgi:hypothetical protein
MSTTLNSARASSFKMKAVHWLWPDRFALGKPACRMRVKVRCSPIWRQQ